MGSFSIWHLLILAAVVFLLFGRGRVSDLMGDVAKGIKNFREGLKDEEEERKAQAQPAPRVLVAEARPQPANAEPRGETVAAEPKEQAGH